MDLVRLFAAALTLALWSACASSSSGDQVDATAALIDAASTVADARPSFDARPSPDARPPADARPVDAGPPDACITGVPESCESCGVACPGLGISSANVDCVTMMCELSCKGERYDVDGNPGNGCERTDSPLNNHVVANAISQGSKPCGDGDSAMTMTGTILSDQRVHENPTVAGFGMSTGSARDYFKVFATGGTWCVNDADGTLTISGSLNPSCYRLTLETNKGTQTCSPTSGNSCTIDQGSGSYDGDTWVYYTIEKTCSSATLVERVTYTLSAHL